MTAERAAQEDDPSPQVVATAGHVDHGKSSLILRLTGIDPDRLAEEKRRGLTIDLGFAWGELPSGREVGFVDVPGHERFVRNMLAGVGPVRLVLFVVAADEGWKPQSEEHLAIVDVLGAHGGVVALTKRDLVDDETLEIGQLEVRERLEGTTLASAPIVPCSATTGEGLDALLAALDGLVASAPAPEDAARTRQFIDRVFPIRGAGTVVTGTLAGGTLEVGREVEVYPTGHRARIRGLQSHKRTIDVARPVARVATNLVGVERRDLERGDVLGDPGRWRPTTTFEASVRPVRGLGRPLTARGAYKLYAGSAERDARVRFYGTTEVGEHGAFARIRLSAPLLLDIDDRFVLREAGRRATVAGGVVLDTEPPLRPGRDPAGRLSTRAGAARNELPAILLAERGRARAADVTALTGLAPQRIPGAVRVGAWWVTEDLHREVAAAIRGELDAFHRSHPLAAGADLAVARTAAAGALERAARRADPGLIDALFESLESAGEIVREGPEVRLAAHRVALEGRRDEVDRLVAAVAAAEPTPPTVGELAAASFPRELVDAAARSGALVRISQDLVMTPAFVARAEQLLRDEAVGGITVSAFREHLGTSRKYALPLLEWFDHRGTTYRRGDLRILRR